jgi:hypothetical protein
MCTAGMAMMGAQAFGVGMSSVGAIFGALMQKDMLRSQARLADINAGIADSNARNITRAGTIEESRVKLAGSQAKATQRAQIASSGVDIANSNTALARLTGTDLITEVDANTVRANATRAAWGQRFEAGNLRRAATSARATASSISPGLVGATSLINGASQVAASWYTLSGEGAFGKGGRSGSVEIEDGTSDMVVSAFPSYTPFDQSFERGPKRNPYAGY